MAPIQSYPSIRYRRGASGDIERCRVQTADEAQALGPEWTDSPATVDRPIPPPPAATAPPKAKKGEPKFTDGE